MKSERESKKTLIKTKENKLLIQISRWYKKLLQCRIFDLYVKKVSKGDFWSL